MVDKFIKPMDELSEKVEMAKQELIEATRQKNQMETILLHMTDGLIAFNIEEEIIHINRAAKQFLNIKEEKTFSEIFSKFDVDSGEYIENKTNFSNEFGKKLCELAETNEKLSAFMSDDVMTDLKKDDSRKDNYKKKRFDDEVVEKVDKVYYTDNPDLIYDEGVKVRLEFTALSHDARGIAK